MSMKNFTAASLLIALGLVSANCGDEGHGQNGSSKEAQEKVTNVKIMVIQPQNFVDFIEVTGTVDADMTITVSAEESGVIEKFVKDKGQWVNKNEVVVKLESKTLEASYEEAQASYLLSEATYNRQANLYHDQVISEQKYLEHKYSLDRDRARYENLKAHLEKTQIKSPVPGMIDDKFAEVGEFVQPGTPLFKIVKTDVVKVIAGVPERFIPHVQLGSMASITFDVFPDEEFAGKITFVGPSINKNSRTFPIEIAMPNQERRLKPEMFAHIKIKKAERTGVVVIPRDAVIETESGKFAFVANSNIAAKRDLKIGGSYNNQVWVEEGLQPGDQLIVVGHRDLVDGERIAIYE